jgi:chemotaxis protein methyltransferase CheR
MPAALALLDRPPPQGAGADTGSAEFSFGPGDFTKVRGLIRDRAGINLQPGKEAMVYSRLSRRLRETGHRSFQDYLRYLESHADGDPEWQEFVNCLTTNLTAFFREDHHFHALAEDVHRFKANELRVWCCAASTGEEPYSIAMTLAESLRAGVQARIVASDIDTNVLNTARRAVYPVEARGLSPERMRRHCLRGTGANAGFLRIKPELVRMIEYRTHNLMHPRWSLGEPFHIVFCRNVMIYFDAATQRQVLERIHAVMQPHGLLYVGHSENFTESRDLFRLRGKTIYERV